MKKKDIILIAAVLAISLISFAAIKMTQKDGKEVIVTVDGKEVYKTSIKKDQIYQIPEENGTNVMQIKDGKVTMKNLYQMGYDKSTCSIIYRNYYHWFERESKGVYILSEEGKNALESDEYAEVVEFYRNTNLEN